MASTAPTTSLSSKMKDLEEYRRSRKEETCSVCSNKYFVRIYNRGDSGRFCSTQCFEYKKEQELALKEAQQAQLMGGGVVGATSKKPTEIKIPAPQPLPLSPRMKKIVLALKIALLVLLYALSAVLEFRAVFFIALGFYLIYETTTTRRRQKWEKSAYSVFNPNMEKLQGTFDGESFDKQLR
jgi:hypothetical protein